MKRTAAVLAVFAVVYSALALFQYTRTSATWDEPQHLVRGLLGWRGDHRMDPEHPPLLRLWAALPVAFDPGVPLDTSVINQTTPADWVGLQQFQYARHFLYRVNDADRLLYRARFMNVLLGILLGILLFAWVNEWLGFQPATFALACFTLEPNLLAHASLVTTDLGVTAFIFGTLYFLWRTTRKSTPGNRAGVIVFFALAMASKFTTVMLVPVILALLVIDAYRKPNPPRQLALHAGLFAGMLLAAWITLWAAYGFRYAPSADSNWLFQFQNGSPFGGKFPVFARLAVWADEHRLLPNACTQGFLLGQIKAQSRGAYLFGEFSTTGWWYYFPIAFLIKTPVTLLVLMAGGLALVIARWRQLLDTPIFLLLAPAIIVGLAMTQKLNIGLRHILPVYPLLLMLAAVPVAWLTGRSGSSQTASSPRRDWSRALPLAIVLAALEFASVYPSPLAFFNILVGGPNHGDECLVDSNLDWGQDLKGVKRWMTANHVDQINLCYFGSADPAYYRINATPLPGNGLMERGQAPELPGYVAISVTNLRGAYFPEQLRQFYRPLLSMTPVAKIGHSILIYQVEKPWWTGS